ncbi:hypothetical protein L6452_27441 [Arctium lappa]|uniref:Uncharacterized protein n=1 Tax=Arctium lappa TaxID=4217 RepID=A0ACB8ZWB8_ARCLA|nr:hypothetical protein L6452_27441 [Arctium lappa]
MEFQPQEVEVEEEEEGEMALPISSTYGDGHMISHYHDNHIVPLSSLHHHHQHQQPPPAASTTSMAVVVRYKECLKNHAAAMGGKATDGCGEFMACGEEGTLEALTCSVCNCHRNFHRKEIIDNNNYPPPHLYLKRFHELGNGINAIIHPKGFLGTTQESFGYNHNNNNNNNAGGALVPSIKGPPPTIMPYNMTMGSESDHHQQAPPYATAVKKRFRTKFSHEQKEKMLSFAEKVGWKMQKQEESMIQDFCQQVGIKRRVLKVWMHNNKQNLAKNTCSNSISINPPQDPN